MMYHKNRLIKAYKRVGCQLKVSLCCFDGVLFTSVQNLIIWFSFLTIVCLLQANVKGLGVIGVIECDFLEPTHNKQSFIDTDKLR